MQRDTNGSASETIKRKGKKRIQPILLESPTKKQLHHVPKRPERYDNSRTAAENVKLDDRKRIDPHNDTDVSSGASNLEDGSVNSGSAENSSETQSQSSYSSNDEEQSSSSEAVTAKRSLSPSKRQKRNVVVIPTEIMAAKHMLHDEIRNYIRDQELPRQERVALVDWYKSLRDVFENQNSLLVENSRLAKEHREVDGRIKKQRREVVELQAQIRALERENEHLEVQIRQSQSQGRAQREATKLLEGLEKALARSADEK